MTSPQPQQDPAGSTSDPNRGTADDDSTGERSPDHAPRADSTGERSPGNEPGSEPGSERRSVLLGRLPLGERTYLADALRTETVGGMVLLVAALVALVLANTGLSGFYEDVKNFSFGPGSLHLHLSVSAWAQDGLLTVFFFVAGIELKRELVAGELRDPRAAALPVVAALSGMAVPALVYTGFALAGGGDLRGWAIPMATDIAFALGVLAVLGTGLPSALRAFLLTLAVVDDLGAIVIIAVFYSQNLDFLALGGALAGLVLFRFLHFKGVRGWYVYVPLGVVIWALMHASGVHATVAGVAMGLLLRCVARPGESASPGERIEHRVRPLSAGLAVPVFALFAAGVGVSGHAVTDVFTKPETLGVVFGLLVGKAVGVFGGTWLAARFTRAQLNRDLAWADVLAIAALAGIGFTVSLLIGELAFVGHPLLTEEAKAAVLMGSLLAVLVSGVLLKLRAKKHRALLEEEDRDEDANRIPDIYEEGDPEYHLRMASLYEAKAAEHRRLAEVAGGGDVAEDGPA